MNENETNAAPIVPPTSASGCSKSESDTPRTDTFYDDHLDFGYYESDEWYKFASLLELDLNRALSVIRELLNDGCDYPNPHTGDAEQFRADVRSIAAWLEETEAKSKACADSFNPAMRLGGNNKKGRCDESS